ncbi:LysR family transcriptional regulator [Pedococcus soli]
MELRHLEAFLAVVEHKGFRRAADHLYLSQPAVSARIHELELTLGVPVFARGQRSIELTPAGQALLGPAQRMLDAARAARRSAQLAAFSGEVELAIMPGGALELTRPLLVELGRRFPGVDFHLRPLSMQEWYPGILAEVDLLITREPFPVAEAVVTELLSEPMGVGVPSAFEESRAPQLTLDDVVSCAHVRMTDTVHPQIVRHWSLTSMTNDFEVERRGPGADGPLQTRDRVESGFGLAVAPASVARLYGQGGYRFVPLVGVPDSRVVLVSAVAGTNELVRAIHREAADVVARLTPLVLGGESSAVDRVVAAAMQL